MTQQAGPRLFYPLEAVSACITDHKSFSLRTPFSTLDDDEEERRWAIWEFCTPMLLAAQDHSKHFERLDYCFSSLLSDALIKHPSQLLMGDGLSENTNVSRANDILRRLPSLPQRLFALPLNNSGLRNGRKTLWDGIKDGSWASRYILPEAQHHLQQRSSDDPTAIMELLLKLREVAWTNLFVTTFIDTNSIVLILRIAEIGTTGDLSFATDFLQYINVLAKLLDEYEELKRAADLLITRPFEDPSPSVQALKSALFPEVYDEHEQGRAILGVFLWTAWQRSVMLYFYYIIGIYLSKGYSSK